MQKKTWFGNALLAAAVALLAVILVAEIGATRSLNADYQALEGAELSETEASFIAYSDGFATDLAFASTDTVTGMEAFLAYALAHIDMRIMGAFLFYAAAVSVLMACYLAQRFRDDARKHYAAAALCGPAVYLLMLAAVYGTMLVLGTPMYLPDGTFLLVTFVGMASVAAGNCAVAACLRRFKAQALISILAFALVAATYLFVSLIEVGLFSDVAEESFTGGLRIVAVVLEAVNTFSGTPLALIQHAADLTIPGLALVLYLIKAALWIALPMFLSKRTAQNTQGRR